MNDNVRVYHVDEYCEGASHFSFSARKDVVLLEDYEKLREENERLKSENAKLKCWALHLSENYFIVWAAYFFKQHKRKRAKRIENLSEKYGVEYRMAKKALRESKC